MAFASVLASLTIPILCLSPQGDRGETGPPGPAGFAGPPVSMTPTVTSITLPSLAQLIELSPRSSLDNYSEASRHSLSQAPSHSLRLRLTLSVCVTGDRVPP